MARKNGAYIKIDDKLLKEAVREYVSPTVEQKGREVAKAIESLTPQEHHAKVSSRMEENRKGYPVSLQFMEIEGTTPLELQATLGLFSRATLLAGLEIGEK